MLWGINESVHAAFSGNSEIRSHMLILLHCKAKIITHIFIKPKSAILY